MAEISDLETTDSDNITRWPENMLGASVNDSARALEGILARWFTDTNGTLETSGTSTAYTITTNRSPSALSTSLLFLIRPHTNCGAAPTLKINSLDAKTIKRADGTAIISGDLVSGIPYLLWYDGTNFRAISLVPSGLLAIDALSGTTGVVRKTGAASYSLDDGTTAILFARNNSGNVIPTGVQGDIPIPFACTITGVELLGNPSGSLVIDLWKDSLANFPPTDADSITASAPPTLSSAASASDTTLTGWTKSISAGDIIRVNVDSVSTVTMYTLAITVKRFI